MSVTVTKHLRQLLTDLRNTEKTLESPLDCKKIQPVHSEGDQPWEGLMVKLKLQYFGHLMRRVDSLEKTNAGRDWGQEEKGMTEDEMAGWHH